jgi:hypothetical protein
MYRAAVSLRLLMNWRAASIRCTSPRERVESVRMRGRKENAALVGAILGLAETLIGCGAGPAPRASASREAEPARAESAAAPRSAPPPASSAEPARAPGVSPIAHEYRRIFDGWAKVVFPDGRPLLISSEGAVELSSGRVSFERLFSNAAVYEGNSVWFADGFSPMSACPEPSVLVERVGSDWRPRHQINVHQLFVSRWLPGSSLAAIVPRRTGPPWGYELLVLEKNRKAPVPERSGRARKPECHTRIETVLALEAFPSGEIFAFGSECPLLPPSESDAVEGEERDSTSTLVVELWKKGSARSSFAALPLSELTSTFGVSADDIWATGSPSEGVFGVAHYDGSNWTLLPERFEQAVSAWFVPAGEHGVDARRFFVVGQKLFEFSAGNTREHALPESCVPLDVELHDGELWLTCSLAEYELALFTTNAQIQPFRFSDDVERSRVTWTETPYPPLDPKGPRSGGCGGARREPYEDRSFGAAPPKTSKGTSKPGKPAPRPATGRKTLRNFGY